MNGPSRAEIQQAQHRVFVRKARDASHQALYFLGLLDDTTSDSFRRAVDEYRPFALGQVQATVRGVSVPEADGETSLEARWRELVDTLDGEVDVQVLRRRLAEFLDASRATSFAERLSAHWLPDILRWLRRNLSVLWAWALLVGVVLGVEAVRALLWNEGWRLLVPVVLLSVPLSVSRLWSRVVRRRRGSVPFWDFAGPIFRAFRHAASEPGSLVVRFPLDSRLPSRILLGHFVKVGAYVLWWALAFTSCLLWSRSERLGTGDSSLTVFLVMSLFYALLLAAYSLDFWDYLDRAPVRLLVLLVAGVALFALLAGRGNGFFIVACLAGAAGYGWAFLRRRRRPLRLVLALLLALIAIFLLIRRDTRRRELWTESGQPWQRLSAEDWPYPARTEGSELAPPVVVMAASGGGSRAALWTGLTLQRLQRDHPEIAAQLQAISSVSGGSLANAAYVSLRMSGWPSDDPCSGATLGELDRAMGRDFLLPTLRGALTPGTSRGTAIENAWRTDPICLGDHRLSDLAAAWRAAAKQGEPAPPFPVPLFNSTTLDAHDVVITPLAGELYLPARNADTFDAIDYWNAGDDDPLTWVFDRDAIYSLEDLVPNFDPPLASAVRASANFPFGFPLVEIETSRPLTFSPLRGDHDRAAGNDPHHVSLTDGGALSNSGMWSLTELLTNRQSDLEARGVLLIIVEASKMPSFASLDKKLQRLWGTIGDQSPIGQGLHRAMLDRLAAIYGDRLRVVQIDLVPLESHNVFTTWALDGRSIRDLKSTFDERRWTQESSALGSAWCHLTCREPATCDRCDDDYRPSGLEGRRPPVD